MVVRDHDGRSGSRGDDVSEVVLEQEREAGWLDATNKRDGEFEVSAGEENEESRRKQTRNYNSQESNLLSVMPAVASHPRWQRALSRREVENGATVEEDDLVSFVLSSSISSLGVLRRIGSIEFRVGEGRTNSSSEFPLSTFDLNERTREEGNEKVSRATRKSLKEKEPTHLSRPTS